MKKNIGIIVIILTAGILRFYNLMHDSPHFFNPDERNMASAIVVFKLPVGLKNSIVCIANEFNLSITNYQFPNCNLNPHFFAYGQFPLYLTYASDQITKPILLFVHPELRTTNSELVTSFPSAIFWLRFWSAFSSVLTVFFVYLVTKILIQKPLVIGNWKLEIGNLAALLAAFSPGLIQSAHFGTTESLLTFFFLGSVYFSMRLFTEGSTLLRVEPYKITYLLHNTKYVILIILSVGLALGSKLTGLFFLIPPAVAVIIQIIRILFQKRKKGLWGFCLPAIALTKVGVIGLLVLMGSILIGILSSPYNVVDPESFKSAVFGYEADVAMGKYEAFYTRQFANTTPILFQIEKVFPYVLGWPVFILGTIGFILICISILLPVIRFLFSRITYYVLRIKKKRKYISNIRNTYYVILTTSFLVYLLPNAFLFAKWTRFMTPILPFFAVFATIALSQLYSFLQGIRSKIQSSKFKVQKKIVTYLDFGIGLKFGFWILILPSVLPGLAFMSIYTHEDSRVQASKWIYRNIPNNSYILSETANVIDIPVGLPQSQLTEKQFDSGTVVSYDFYHLDENPTVLYPQLIDHLEKANYIFIPSRRLFKNYPRLSKQYPLVTKYYQLLFSGALGFDKAYELASFPKIGPWQFPDEDAEETYSVFDHPVIRVYKKVKEVDYKQVLPIH